MPRFGPERVSNTDQSRSSQQGTDSTQSSGGDASAADATLRAASSRRRESRMAAQRAEQNPARRQRPRKTSPPEPAQQPESSALFDPPRQDAAPPTPNAEAAEFAPRRTDAGRLQPSQAATREEFAPPQNETIERLRGQTSAQVSPAVGFGAAGSVTVTDLDALETGDRGLPIGLIRERARAVEARGGDVSGVRFQVDGPPKPYGEVVTVSETSLPSAEAVPNVGRGDLEEVQTVLRNVEDDPANRTDLDPLL